jgi:hypothetical protein
LLPKFLTASLGSSERLGGFVKEEGKKKKKAWQAALPFVVVPHGANTKQPESKSQKTTPPPNFIIKYFFEKIIN